MREQFEEKYREMHPDDTCTLMPSGNYSGWMKQASWEGWQMRQAEVSELQFKIEMALISLNHLQENAVTHRDHGTEHTALRDFNDLIELASDIREALGGAGEL